MGDFPATLLSVPPSSVAAVTGVATQVTRRRSDYIYCNINQSVIITTFFSGGVRMFEGHKHAESCEIFNVNREHPVTFCPLALYFFIYHRGHPRGQVYCLGRLGDLSFNIQRLLEELRTVQLHRKKR